MSGFSGSVYLHGHTQRDLTAPVRIAARNILGAVEADLRGDALLRRVRIFMEDARTLLASLPVPASHDAIGHRQSLETLIYALEGVIAPAQRGFRPVNPAEVRWCLGHWLAANDDDVRPAA